MEILNMINENSSSAEISTEISEQEKKLKEAIAVLETISVDAHQISKEILLLRVKKKDLEILIDKAKSSMNQLKLDIKILTQVFWASKNQGL
jgi:peptidoglycan hydrolase CwlO-like protein